MTVPDVIPPPAVNVDEQTLKYLGYDPKSIATRALVLLAQRYELDPLLGEIMLIPGQGGNKLYVSRDGLLSIAHRSGQLDGITVDEQRRNSTGDGWTCFVSVWRRDMSHPFTYGAQCKDTEPQAKVGNGPEMALARAERRALRRAFQIRTDFNPEHPNEELDHDLDADLEAEAGTMIDVRPPAVGTHPVDRAGDWTPTDQDQVEARTALANWPVKRRLSFFTRHRIEHFDEPWPPEAVAEILAGPAAGNAGEASESGPASLEGL